MKNNLAIPGRIRRKPPFLNYLLLLSFLAGCPSLQAQFTFSTNSGALTVVAYDNSAMSVDIPATAYGLAVTAVGESAFAQSTNLTDVTVPASVTRLGSSAFANCSGLKAIYFQGNAPELTDTSVFNGDNATAYYNPGAAGWTLLFGGLSAVPLSPQSLRVTIDPVAAITSGAKWNVDGGDWQNSGSVVSNLSAGSHEVSFLTIEGWAACTNQTVVIRNDRGTAGAGAYTFIDNYGLAVNGGFESGDFSGWTFTGGLNSAFVANDSQIGILPRSGRYEAALGQVGSLGYLAQTIPTTPGANYAVSFWINCDGQTPNRFLAAWNGKSVFDVSNLPNTGWTNVQFLVSATSDSAALQFGFQDDKSYLGLDDVSVQPAPANAGALQVIIQPSGAVNSGAQWQLDGGDPQPSGANLLGISVGTHTVSFTPVSGWKTPTNQLVTIKNGQSTSATGLYSFIPNYGLVTNGGFETKSFSGWTLTGDPNTSFVDDSSLTGIPPQSERYVAGLGEAGSLGYLTQTITTAPGTNYLLSFWVYSDGQAPNRFLASWNEKTLIDLANLPAVGWTNMQFAVSATTAKTSLRFGFQDDNSYLGLDNVSLLVAQAPQTPVAITSVMMLGGQFSVTTTGPAGASVVLEACTDLTQPAWVPVHTNILNNGFSTFTDASSANTSRRFFRIKR